MTFINLWNSGYIGTGNEEREFKRNKVRGATVESLQGKIHVQSTTCIWCKIIIHAFLK